MVFQCNDIYIDNERGEIICRDTGEVLYDHMIDIGPEWRGRVGDYEEWVKRARTGPKLSFTIHDSGLVTDIDLSTKSYREKVKYLKLRSLQKKIRIAKSQRKLVEALALMNQTAAVLGLPDIVKETAGMIIKKLFSKMQIKQNKIRAYVAAALVIAVRKHGIPMRVNDIIKHLGVSKNEYWDATADIQFNLDPSEIRGIIDPRRFLGWIVSKLGLSPKVYMIASHIIAALKERGYTEGKDPAGIAAAAVYVASIIANEKRTQKEIAEVTGITEVTIRNRYRDMIDKLVIEVYV